MQKTFFYIYEISRLRKSNKFYLKKKKNHGYLVVLIIQYYSEK